MLTRHLGQMVAVLALINTLALAGPGKALAADAGPVKIVALGDSLMAGYKLPSKQGFPEALERVLKAGGAHEGVTVANAGVSGDTTSAGLGRLDWSVPEGTDAVILGLGANDMLRGVAPERARANLDQIIKRLKARGIQILLVGMRAPRNLGEDYAADFDRIYPELAERHGLLLYPFFLDGVALDPKLNQSDGIHPNADGVHVIVERIKPKVEALIAQVKARRSAHSGG